MRPVRESMPPEIFAELTKIRGPQKAPVKEQISLRVGRDVLDHFRAAGSGWQTKINNVLRQSAKAEDRARRPLTEDGCRRLVRRCQARPV